MPGKLDIKRHSPSILYISIYSFQSAKDDDTKSVASIEDDVFVDDDDDDKNSRMSRMDKRKDELARQMTEKRRPKKHGGTLSQNFVKNFK